jgi:hypothetical protein
MADNQILIVPSGAELIAKIGSTEYTVVNSSGKCELDVVGDVTGDVTGDLTGDVTGQCFGTVTSYTASGAIALTDKAALLDATGGALAMTLADGTEGQVIYLKCVDASNNAVVTPANLADGSTLTFDAANEVAVLLFDGTNWQVITNTSTLA